MAAKKLGLWSGVGLVIANMIGAGVLISTGFAAMDLAPSHILLAWLVVLVTLLHAFNLRASRTGQNLMVIVKFALVLGFVLVGLIAGSNAWPNWRPAPAMHGLPIEPFFGTLVFIAFCYSGWNAAIYASEEFADPRRDVPRAMMIGCSIVIVLYLLVNWVFVANLNPTHFGQWISGDHDRITLGHFLMKDLIGGVGAKVMSVFMIVTLIAAASAMTMLGPRVYAAMARDGYLPRVFAAKDDGHPPVWSVLLQGALALAVSMTTDFIHAIQTVGSILTLMAALTVLGVFKVQFSHSYAEKPGPVALIAATIFVGLAVWMLYFAFTSPFLNSATFPIIGRVSLPLIWLAFIAGGLSAIYAVLIAKRRRGI